MNNRFVGFLMNRLQAMAQIMTLLNPNGDLKPGSPVYKRVREMASEKIDSLGPTAAVAYIRKDKGHLLHQIKMNNAWYKATGCIYTDYILVDTLRTR